VLEGNTLPDDMATPHYGTDVRPVQEAAPTVQSPVIRPPKPPEARPEPSRAPRQAPALAPPEPVPVVAAPATAPSRGPAFWLMIAASALALLFVGAALGLAAAFIAKRMGWL